MVRSEATVGTRLSFDGIDADEPRALCAAQWARHLAWSAAGRP